MKVSGIEKICIVGAGNMGHPMGPFRLMDIVGIGLWYNVCVERYKETADPAYKPSPVVVEKFIGGHWGRKTGKGFYDYSRGTTNPGISDKSIESEAS